MPSFKTAYIFAFIVVMCGIAALGITTLRYNNAIPDPSSVKHTLIVLYQSEKVLSQATENQLGLNQTIRENTVNKRRQERNILIWTLLISVSLLTGVLFYLILHHFSRRKKAEQHLLNSEERFRLLIKNVRDYAIFMIGPTGHVMSWNEGARQIKGYTEEEIIGRHISTFYTDEEVISGAPEAHLKEALREGRSENIGWRKRKDGSVFWANIILTPLYNSEGILRGFAKITRDITGQKEAQEEINKALEWERELNTMKSRFVSLASHEFKTPLSIILSSVSLIGKYTGADMDEKRQKHVLRIKSSVKNLKQILDDFLSVEKLERGIVINKPVEFDLIEFINQIIDDTRDSCKVGQEIIYEVEGDLIPVVLDSQLLLNILNNLLSNAIKYSPENSLVELYILFGGESLSLRVKDKGIGIPPAELPTLFQQFFRATNTAGVSGTGLGMSIVKKYLELMGGDICVTSELGIGSEFTIVLPL